MGASLRVLMVEDEMLIAVSLEAMLEDLGHEVVGIVGRLDEALVAAKATEFDFAIVDVKLGEEASFPLADLLIEMGKSFVFSTGYGETDIGELYTQPILSKPYDEYQLVTALAKAAPGRDLAP